MLVILGQSLNACFPIWVTFLPIVNDVNEVISQKSDSGILLTVSPMTIVFNAGHFPIANGAPVNSVISSRKAAILTKIQLLSAEKQKVVEDIIDGFIWKENSYEDEKKFKKIKPENRKK